MVTYKSLTDVPPDLGTRSDWRTVGRLVVPDAPPDAHVKDPRATLYRIENTRRIPDLTETALEGLRRAQRCTACGQVRRNPLGKIMLPATTGMCVMCTKTKNKKDGQ